MAEKERTQMQQTGEWGDSTMDYTQTGFQEEPYIVSVIEGPSCGQRKAFDATLMVGRHPNCGLLLDDGSVSREHLWIERKGKKCVAINLNSKNFTLVNGKKITTAALRDGDVLTLGSSKLRFNMAGGEAAAPANNSNRVRILLLLLLVVLLLLVLFIALGTNVKGSRGEEKTILEQERVKEAVVKDVGEKRARELYQQGLTRIWARPVRL